MRIGRIKELTFDDHKQLVDIKKSYFSEENISSAELTWEIYKRNPDTLIVLGNPKTREILASVFLLPVSDNAFRDILEGKYVSSTVALNDVAVYDNFRKYNIYLCSIVVRNEYINSDIFRKIYFECICFFRLLAKRGIYISEVAAEAFTDKGEKLCKNILSMELIKILDRPKCKIYKANKEIVKSWYRKGVI